MEIKLSKRRFLILGLYCLISLHINSQWTQYQVIADILRPFYHISNTDIDWTVTLWCPVYLVGCFVSAFCLDKIGLRFCLLAASLLNLAGSAVKYYAIIEPHFLIACFGQVLVATAQVFIFFLPANIALTWFPVEFASTVTAIALFPMYFGNGLGYFLPIFSVPNGLSADSVKLHLKFYFGLNSVAAGVILILNLLFFKDRPKYAPSLAAAKVSDHKISFFKSWKLILTNRASNYILVTFTFLQTIDNVLLGLLSPIIGKYFPGKSSLIGISGAIVSASSVIGSLALAWITDKTRKYKLVTFITSIITIPLFGLLIYSLKVGSEIPSIALMTILGFLLAGTYPIGMDFIVQANYPMSESICSTLLMFSNQLISWIATILVSNLIQNSSLYSAFTPIGLMLGSALIVGIFTENNLNRDEANKIDS